jgi:hypothetical protein
LIKPKIREEVSYEEEEEVSGTEDQSEQEDGFDMYRNKDLSTIYEENPHEPTSRVDDDFESTNLRRTILSEDYKRERSLGSEFKSGGERWSNCKKKTLDVGHNKCVSFSERALSDAGIIGGVSSHQNSEQLFQKSYRNYSSIDCDREKRHETPKGAANRKSDENFLVGKGQKKMIKSQNTPKNNVDEKINPSSSSDSQYNYTFEQARKAISDLEKKRERLERENHQLILKNDQTTQKLSVNNAGLLSSPETDARDQPTVAEVSGDTYGGRSRFLKDKSGKICSISIESTSIDRTPFDPTQNFDSLLSLKPPKPQPDKITNQNPSSTQPSQQNTFSNPSPSPPPPPDYDPRNIQQKNEILKEFQLNYNINTPNYPSDLLNPKNQSEFHEPNHIETSPIVNAYENSKIDNKMDYSQMGKSKSSDKDIEEIRDQILTRRNNIS